MPKHVRILVVGGGLAGMSVASSLANAGHESLVLEAHFPAWGASGRNAGFVLAEGPDLLPDGQTHARTLALREAGLATRARLRRLARTQTFDYEQTGSLRLAHDEAEADSFRKAPPSDGVTVLVGDALPSPWRGGPWSAGRVDAGDGVVDPAALVRAFRADAQAQGAVVHTNTPVRKLRPAADCVHVATERGTVRAERVVVATNAWTRRLLPEAAIRPRRAQMLEAQVNGDLDWTQPVYARGGADYWRAMPDGRVLLGGCRDAGGADEETDTAEPGARVQAALDRLLPALVPGHEYTVTRRWAGIMGFTPDGAPFLGPTEPSGRLWLFAGFHGHGLGWAPGLADLLARAVTRAEPVPAVFRVQGRTAPQ